MDLWAKGHSPKVKDTDLQRAIKKFNMLETGFTFKPGDLPAIEVELVNILKSNQNKKQLKRQRKMREGVDM